MLEGAGEVSLKRFLANISYTIGLTNMTAMKYLNELEALGFIEVDEIGDLVKETVTEEAEEVVEE